MTCPNCKEWFEVWTNTGSPGLAFCPCCGYEFTGDDLTVMDAEDAAREGGEG